MPSLKGMASVSLAQKHKIMFRKLFILLLIALASCKSNSLQKEVQDYLDSYNNTYQKLYTASSEASWKVNTMIIQGDSSNAVASRKADEALAAFTGSKTNIEN